MKVLFSFCQFTPRLGGGGGMVIVNPKRYPHPADRGGYPISDQEEGYPHPADGGERVLPSQVRMGVTRLAGWRYSPVQIPDQEGGGGPQLEQHNVYLLHGGRYVSCVHARGLSYYNLTIR